MLVDLLKKFDERREKGMLATDQLLNAFFLVTRGRTFTARRTIAASSRASSCRDFDGR